MLKFIVHQNGQITDHWQLTNAHMLGPDDVGVRATITCEGGVITCDKRTVGPAALALQYPVGDLGEFTLQTCLLPDRDEPYLLSLELARHRIMKVIAKQEDWGMFDLGDDHPVTRRISRAKSRFVEALNEDEASPAANKLSREALLAALDASEELSLAHADAMTNRRQRAGQPVRSVFFGCSIALPQKAESVRSRVLSNFDYVTLPTPWKQLEPEEQEYDWTLLDNWAEWAFRSRLPILAGPLVSFESWVVPDWLYIWEHDYDTVRDLIYEHVERVVSRYRNVVTLWNVVSGIHVNKHFTFNFDQLMDLTRMAVMLTKKVQPTARTLIELTQPFGEYYAANQRSIPPMMYAELVLQSGIPFDGFGLQILMGQPVDGSYTRDLMQLSALLDRFSGLGKPVHVTAVAAPSEPVLDERGEDSSGRWRKPWSQLVQGRWLEAFYQIAMSKPFIESVSWSDVVDHEQSLVPGGGLMTSDLQMKTAFRHFAALRKAYHDNAQTGKLGNAAADERRTG